MAARNLITATRQHLLDFPVILYRCVPRYSSLVLCVLLLTQAPSSSVLSPRLTIRAFLGPLLPIFS